MKAEIFEKITRVIIVGSFIAISCFVLAFCMFPFENGKPNYAAAFNFFASMAATITTIGASLIAALLFNDWREEKNFDLEKEYLTNIISSLKPIHQELVKIRSDSANLKKIDKVFIVKTEYITRKNLDLFSSVVMSYPDFKIYSKLKNVTRLTDLYTDFEHHCLCLSDFYNELFNVRYREYYEKVISDNENLGHISAHNSSYNIFRTYPDSRKQSLLIQIDRIKQMFKPNSCIVKNEDSSSSTLYELWLDETLNIHNEIIEYCIKNLKA